MTDNDPNEAYGYEKLPEGERPLGGYRILRNGIPVHYCYDLAQAVKHVTDPEYRKSLVKVKMFDQKPK